MAPLLPARDEISASLDARDVKQLRSQVDEFGRLDVNRTQGTLEQAGVDDRPLLEVAQEPLRVAA